ncbi:MAG: glycine cleavage system pyridoxal-binding protein P, partial [Candidatus Krumholzibacteriia bacterium]
DGLVFNEFVIRLAKSAKDFQAFARQRGVLAGLLLDGIAGCGANDLLVAVTEKRTAAEIDMFGDLLTEYLNGKEEVAS